MSLDLGRRATSDARPGIDHFGELGHISVAVSALDGRPVLEMVQHRVNSGGMLDVIDLEIDASELHNWRSLTIYPRDAPA